MGYKLFLDDIRKPLDCFSYMPVSQNQIYLREDWVIAKNYEDFCAIINNMGTPSFVSFDHDLADAHYTQTTGNINSSDYKEKTGLDCTRFLIDYCMDKKLDFPEYLIHSMNPTGKENIYYLIQNFKRLQKDGRIE